MPRGDYSRRVDSGGELPGPQEVDQRRSTRAQKKLAGKQITRGHKHEQAEQASKIVQKKLKQEAEPPVPEMQVRSKRNKSIISGENAEAAIAPGKASRILRGQPQLEAIQEEEKPKARVGKRKPEEAQSQNKRVKPRETLDDDDIQTKLDAIKNNPPTLKQRNEIRAKYEQLKEKYSSFEVQRQGGKLLTQEELLNIAIYTTTTLPKIARAVDSVLHPEETGLARSIIVTEKGAFLLADHKVSVIKGQGTFKSASSAIDLISTNQFVLLTTRPDVEMTKQIRAKTFEEGAMQNELLGERGVIPCHTVMDFARGQIAFIVEPASSDLHDHLFGKGNVDPRVKSQKANNELKLSEQVTAMADLAHGLRATHEKGIIHGDIKGENIGLSVDENGTVTKAGLTDYGEGFRSQNLKGKPWSGSEQMKVGLYGTVGYTSPELFGLYKSFDGDVYKTDVWGLGMVAYQMHFGEDPPWKADLFKYHDKCFDEKADRYPDDKNLAKAKAKFEGSIQTNIEDKRAKLLAKLEEDGGLSIDDEYKLVIFDTLRLNPNERITAEEMAQRMDAIQERMNAEEAAPPLVDVNAEDEPPEPVQQQGSRSQRRAR